MKELKRICCSEVQRELKNYERMNFLDTNCRKAVHSNQLTVQVQELQDRVNFLNDSSVVKDPETASSSGSFHVLSHPFIFPNSFGKPCRDSSPQPDTQNLCSIPGKRFL